MLICILSRLLSQVLGKLFPCIPHWLTTPDNHPLPSFPSITLSIGALYLYSGDSIHKHTANGLETALGEQQLHSLIAFSTATQIYQWDLVPQVLLPSYSYLHSHDSQKA